MKVKNKVGYYFYKYKIKRCDDSHMIYPKSQSYIRNLVSYILMRIEENCDIEVHPSTYMARQITNIKRI